MVKVGPLPEEDDHDGMGDSRREHDKANDLSPTVDHEQLTALHANERSELDEKLHEDEISSRYLVAATNSLTASDELAVHLHSACLDDVDSINSRNNKNPEDCFDDGSPLEQKTNPKFQIPIFSNVRGIIRDRVVSPISSFLDFLRYVNKEDVKSARGFVWIVILAILAGVVVGGGAVTIPFSFLAKSGGAAIAAGLQVHLCNTTEYYTTGLDVYYWTNQTIFVIGASARRSVLTFNLFVFLLSSLAYFGLLVAAGLCVWGVPWLKSKSVIVLLTGGVLQFGLQTTNTSTVLWELFSPSTADFAFYYPVYIVGLVAATSVMAGLLRRANLCKREVFKYACLFACNSVVMLLGLQTVIEFYFRVDDPYTRLILRCVAVPVLRELSFLASLQTVLKLDNISRPADKCMFLLHVLVMATAASHCMQIAAPTIWEAILGEAFSVVMEYRKASKFLKGKTSRDSWDKWGRWLLRKCRFRVNAQEPPLASDAKHQEMVAILKCLLMIMSVVDSLSVTLFAMMYLILPLNPGAEAGPPQAAARTMTLWVITMVGGLLVPEFVVAVLSSARARKNNGESTSSTSALELLSLKHLFVAGFISLMFLGEMQSTFVHGICATPIATGNDGMPAWVFGQCMPR